MRLIRAIHSNPLRCTVGLALFLVGLLRSNLFMTAFTRTYVEPQWLYGGLQCLAGLGLLLTLTRRWTWYGRIATIVAVTVAGMVAFGLYELGSTGAVIYAIFAGMLIFTMAVPHGG